jgi:hypothetical protein
MLRYLSLAESVAGEGPETPKRSIAAVYLILSVLRSDARALSTYLRRRSGKLLAGGFEAEIFSLTARELVAENDRLRERGRELRSVKATIDGLAANLGLELRRAFERDFPVLEKSPSLDEIRQAVRKVSNNLRPALQSAVMFLGRSLGSQLDARGVFDDDGARRVLGERLRRDVWMFSQIVRAFALKAQAVASHKDETGWSGGSPLSFVRDFLAYFRAMGFPLLRAADYPRVDDFVSAMDSLRDSDLLDPHRLEVAIDEAEQFYVFLSDLFEAIGCREELADQPFDRRAAAEALRLYLGE